MATCFVIQPFDQGGPYDKRFEDVFAPAIRKAGLEPYRVDQDPGAAIPIEDIEAGIKRADICFAEISEDNPNVWYELGFAMAAKKRVVMVCSDKRVTAFPFDVRHRAIIKYKTEARQDFDALEKSLVDKITNYLGSDQRFEDLLKREPVADIKGLSPQAVVALVSVGQHTHCFDMPNLIGIWEIERDMERAGFTAIATRLGLHELARAGLISHGMENDDRNGEEYPGYQLDGAGGEWLLANQDSLTLRQEPEPPKNMGDDNIPF